MTNSEMIRSETQRRADRLLTQQCLVRRFMHFHNQDYEFLKQIRDSINKALDESEDGFNFGLMGVPIASRTAALLSLFETKSGKDIIRQKDIFRAKNYIGKGKFGQRWIGNDALGEIIEYLAGVLDDFECIQDKYNYFDYVRLSALLCYCSGKKLYFRNRDIRFATRDIDEVNQGLIKEPDDIDLAFALNASRKAHNFNHPGIEILYSEDNPKLKAVSPEENSIYLKVNLDRAPLELDTAIQYFCESIFDLLTKKHGLMANVINHEDFMESKFMNSRPNYTPVFYRNDQINGSLLGLWCWDLVHIDGLKYESAKNKILPSTDTKPTEIVDSEEGAIRNHYKTIRALIDPKNYKPNNRKQITIDEALTGNPSKTIGLRKH